MKLSGFSTLNVRRGELFEAPCQSPEKLTCYCSLIVIGFGSHAEYVRGPELKEIGQGAVFFLTTTQTPKLAILRKGTLPGIALEGINFLQQDVLFHFYALNQSSWPWSQAFAYSDLFTIIIVQTSPWFLICTHSFRSPSGL